MNASTVVTWSGLWPVLALINAGLAQGKGRSGAIWFLISLLAGPLATLMIVVLPSVEPEDAERSRSADARLGMAVLVVIGALLVIALLGLYAARI